jgi:hypothetical protein
MFDVNRINRCNVISLNSLKMDWGDRTVTAMDWEKEVFYQEQAEHLHFSWGKCTPARVVLPNEFCLWTSCVSCCWSPFLFLSLSLSVSLSLCVSVCVCLFVFVFVCVLQVTLHPDSVWPCCGDFHSYTLWVINRRNYLIHWLEASCSVWMPYLNRNGFSVILIFVKLF